MCAALGYMGESYGLQVNDLPAIKVSSKSVLVCGYNNSFMVTTKIKVVFMKIICRP